MAADRDPYVSAYDDDEKKLEETEFENMLKQFEFFDEVNTRTQNLTSDGETVIKTSSSRTEYISGKRKNLIKHHESMKRFKL